MFHIHHDNGITAATRPKIISGRFYTDILHCKLSIGGNVVYETICSPCRSPQEAVDAAIGNYKRYPRF